MSAQALVTRNLTITVVFFGSHPVIHEVTITFSGNSSEPLLQRYILGADNPP